MTIRVTVVLEYAKLEDIPRIGPGMSMADFGAPRIPACQFSDALAEVEYLSEHVDDETMQAAYRAGYNYEGSTHPDRTMPSQNGRGEQNG